MLTEIKETYRGSLKPQDIAWNIWVARPIAALFVVALKRTPLTPNQITFLGALVFLAICPPLFLLPNDLGFLIAAGVIQLAYVFDCVDGQLARIKGMTSDVGAYLDFLIDEVKASVMMGALGIHLYLRYDEVYYLYGAVASVALVSLATSLTTFVRRPEYSGVDIKPGESARRSKERPKGPVALAIWLVTRVLSYFVHYPSWVLYPAIVGYFAPIDGAQVFTAIFMAVYCIYVAKTGAGVLLKLAHPRFYTK